MSEKLRLGIVGIGNIKGQAYEMVTHYEGGEQN